MSAMARKKELTHKQRKRGYKLYVWLAKGWSRKLKNELPREQNNGDLIRGTAILASAIEAAKITGRPEEVILHVSDCRVEEAKKLEAILRSMGLYAHKREYDFGKTKAYFRSP